MKVTKQELQGILKDRYGINKEISKSLSVDECRCFITLLSSDASAIKIVNALIAKNRELAVNNQQLGRRYSKELEKKEEELKKEKEKAQLLQNELQLARMENNGQNGTANQENNPSQGRGILENRIATLAAQAEALEKQMTSLAGDNQKLVEVNDDLKKDNRDMKNIVDAIRLRFSLEIEQIMEQDDAQLRQAILKMYQSVLG